MSNQMKYLFLISLLLSFNVYSQKVQQIEIIQANSLEGNKVNGEDVRRLVGDVIFKQETTMLYCDSALFFVVSNSIEAYGHVRVEGPTAKLSGDVLHYEGNTKKAVITGKIVRMTDGKAVLTTDRLNYDLASDVGEYTTGGKVEDKENVLTSQHGYYYSNDKTVFFKDHVVLINPKYVMKSDTLKYNTITETSYFYGPSTIQSTGKDSGFIYCEYGWYNTKTEKAYFSKNAFIRSKESKLNGDSILYDRNTGVGKAWKNVQVTDTVQKVIISGEYATLDEKKGTSFVTGKSMLTKILETDSIYLHADTLYAKQDSATELNTYYAYKHTKIFKSDLQGQCDSLVYSSKDSTIYFYGSPILWNNKNQLTADLITLKLANNKLQTMNLVSNSFITGMEDSLRYNQVKGRNMVGYFSDNKLSKIHVLGNGQTVYYIRNGKKQLTGVNKADCSDMMIYIDSSSVKQISLLQKPDATLYPIKELSYQELRLKDFAWYGEMQPKTKEDIFIWK